MANPDQKTILIEETKKEIIEICKNFQINSGSTDSEIMKILSDLASLYETQERSKFGFR